MATSINTFSFVQDSNSRAMLETAFNAITQLEKWDFMRNFRGESFMFSHSQEIIDICDKIQELGYEGHSGASFGFTMRAMEYIAKNGLHSFETMYIERNPRQPERSIQNPLVRQRPMPTEHLPQ